jgi:hypothetical protein
LPFAPDVESSLESIKLHNFTQMTINPAVDNDVSLVASDFEDGVALAISDQDIACSPFTPYVESSTTCIKLHNFTQMTINPAMNNDVSLFTNNTEDVVSICILC